MPLQSELVTVDELKAEAELAWKNSVYLKRKLENLWGTVPYKDIRHLEVEADVYWTPKARTALACLRNIIPEKEYDAFYYQGLLEKYGKM